MAPTNNFATTPRITGGQAGMRGYLVQTLIALLDGVLTEPPFDCVTIEPNHASEKIDIVWEQGGTRRVTQVKSSANQFTEPDARRWAQELETAHQASECRLCLVGLHSAGLAAMDRVENVILDKKNLDLSAFREQAAHRLDRFLRDEGLDAGTPDDREMLADALTARLATYSASGHPLARPDLIKMLSSWVGDAPKAGIQIAPSRLRHGAEHLFGRDKELAQLDAALADPAIHVLSIVAWGGVGKTSLVVEWMNRLSAKGWPGIARVFDWSFYSQGTRDQGTVSSDTFVAAALNFFGDAKMSASSAPPRDKGARLAELVAQRPTMLVLDGIEPMQHPPGPLGGKFKDPAVEVLLKALSRQNRGLCLVTTREALSDLSPYSATVTPELRLDHLGDEAGATLLRSTGINAPEGELRAASRGVQGHALTLQLLGTFLSQAHGGDIRKRDLVKFDEADAEIQGGHAFRVMAAYENWLGTAGEKGKQQLAVLRLLALFDRPASARCLAALRKKPPIPDLTEPLVSLTDTQWNLCLSRLSKCGLLYVQPDQSVDSHPLMREYFAGQLRDNHPHAWRKAHARLFRHLKDSTKDREKPTIEDLQPLYQAVAHGCQAGMTHQAFEEVFYRRIGRAQEFYVTRHLGAIASNLGGLACFFQRPWATFRDGLPEKDRAWVLNEAAITLRALGRLTEALEPIKAGLPIEVRRQDWTNACIRVSNLSQLQRDLGDLSSSIGSAEQAMEFSKRDTFESAWQRRVSAQSDLATALHEAGQRADAEKCFRGAEGTQADVGGQRHFLYSLPGFHYCQLLSDLAERACWQITTTGLLRPSGCHDVLEPVLQVTKERAAQSVDIAERNNWLLDTALGRLMLGRVTLYRCILEKSQAQGAKAVIEQSVDGLHCAGMMNHLPRGLLTRAWLRYLVSDIDGARADLDEAWEIAERGPMRLHIADIHLHRARLFKDKEELKRARAMIEQCGYWRRKEELEDAEEATKNW